MNRRQTATAGYLRVEYAARAGKPGSDAPVKINGEPERWLVAARLSYLTKRDRERGDDIINGIQTQDQRAAEWAQAAGHAIVAVTRDRNVSGAVPPQERPELGPWLLEPEKLVQYDGIVAYTVDRLSREYYDLGWLRKWAESNRKKLYVIKDRLRWPDDRDGLLWAVAGDRAYQERQDIIERTKRQHDALTAAGKFVGRPPFGFTTKGERYDRRLVPTEAGRKYVPLIFEKAIGGWSQDKIAAWLRAEGVEPVSGTWWPRTIGGLIRNPVYKGHRCKRDLVPPDEFEERDGKIVRYRYGDRWVETARWEYGRTIHRCEALVDAATWQRANEALTTRPRRGHIDHENRAMLAGALYCPFCEDSPMYRHRALSRGRAYFYYRCFGRGSQRASCGNMVPVGRVDAKVNQIIANRFNTQVTEKRVVRGNEAELENRLAEIQFEIKQLGSRDLPDAEYDAELARLRAERDRVAATDLIPDRVKLVPTGDTYRAEWERTLVPERGLWLARHGFRVYASKARVVVVQGGVTVTESL
jgi:DNA invertase Pin-like site-specific DNA recombinase